MPKGRPSLKYARLSEPGRGVPSLRQMGARLARIRPTQTRYMSSRRQEPACEAGPGQPAHPGFIVLGLTVGLAGQLPPHDPVRSADGNRSAEHVAVDDDHRRSGLRLAAQL